MSISHKRAVARLSISAGNLLKAQQAIHEQQAIKGQKLTEADQVFEKHNQCFSKIQALNDARIAAEGRLAVPVTEADIEAKISVRFGGQTEGAKTKEEIALEVRAEVESGVTDDKAQVVAAQESIVRETSEVGALRIMFDDLNEQAAKLDKKIAVMQEALEPLEVLVAKQTRAAERRADPHTLKRELREKRHPKKTLRVA